MAVGLPVKANYAAGDILTATNMNDLSGTFNDVATSYGNAAGKNKIINGDFGIWQRGTSFTCTGYTYTADRFISYGYGTGTTTVSRQTFTPGIAPVAGYEGTYFARVNSTTTSTYFAQRIEDVRTLAGQTVTVSFWVKSASALSNLTVSLSQLFGTGGSSIVTTFLTNGTGVVGTSWTRYSASVALPSVSGKTIGAGSFLILDISSGTLNNNLDFWGVQLEAGSIATPFQTASGGSIQSELAMCQRYYQVLGGVANAYPLIGGYGAAGTPTYTPILFPVPMRTTPTIVKNGTWGVSNCGQPFAVYNSFQGFSIGATVTAAGNFNVAPDSTDDTFTLSAEL